jgi:hypothetical protein
MTKIGLIDRHRGPPRWSVVTAGLRLTEQRFFPACKAERLANTSATRVITTASRNEQLPGSSTRPRHRSASIQGATETPLSPRTLTAPTAPLLPHERWSSATRQVLEPASRPRSVQRSMERFCYIDPANVPRGNGTRCQTRALAQHLPCPGRLRMVRSACLPRRRSLRLGRQGDRALGSYQRVRSIRPILTDGAWVWNAETNDFDRGAATLCTHHCTEYSIRTFLPQHDMGQKRESTPLTPKSD